MVLGLSLGFLTCVYIWILFINHCLPSNAGKEISTKHTIWINEKLFF